MLHLNQIFLIAVLLILVHDINNGKNKLNVNCESANSETGNYSGTSATTTENILSTVPILNYSSTTTTTLLAKNISSTFMNISGQEEEEYLLASETCPAIPQQRIILKEGEDMRMDTEITVVTLNCWGIRFVSKDRVARMTAIAEELASGKYDFVFLQEVWTTEDYERIKSRTGDVLPYSHYFFSGVIGAGICIFSKSPIRSAFFHQWAVNGYIHKIQHGDWFGGKGIGMVEVDHRGLRINLYTAHLHAEYDRANDEYIAHRVTQAYDTAQFISVTSRHADVVIVGGDLNTEPGDLAYRLIVHTAHLVDAFDVAEKKTPNVELLNTCETARNSYTASSSLKLNPFGKRIDYITFKGGNNAKVSALTIETPWPDRVPGEPFSYSDHEAVVTRLRITKSKTVVRQPSFESSKKIALEESVEICNTAIKHLQTTKNMYILLSLAMFVVLSMTASLELAGGLHLIVILSRIIAFCILIFSIFMSVIWHRMEVHGILAGKLGMLLELGKPIGPDAEVLPESSVLLGAGGDMWTDVDPQDCLP